MIQKVTRKEDLEQLIDIAVESFWDAPTIVYIFSDISRRKQYLFHFYRLRLLYGYQYGAIYRIDFNSFLISMNTGQSMTFFMFLTSKGFLLPGMFRKGPFKTMKDIASVVNNRIVEKEKNCNEIYLLATGKGHQKKGYARSLIKHVLSKKTYVDVVSQKNVEFYTQFGFKVIDTIENVFNFTYYRMVREVVHF